MRTYIFSLITLLIIFIIGVVVIYVVNDESERSTADPNEGGSVSDGSAVPPTPVPVPEPATGYRLKTKDGATIAVDALVQREDAIQRAEGFYRLTYDPDIYSIYYNRNAQVIFIDLYSQPIAEARQLAEAHLAEALDLSEDELCQLDITVQTNAFVDPVYADQDLGLSFCQ